MPHNSHHPFAAFALIVIAMLLAAAATVVFASETKAKEIGLDFEVQSLFPAGTFDI